MTTTSKKTMPVLFVGHGSPMNALADNSYTESLHATAKKIPKPRAILSISAHWQTRGSAITSSDTPEQIFDFYGFPDELYNLKYPAKGSSAMAMEIRSVIGQNEVVLDNGLWGLDHGTWSILRHLYPSAEVPVLQLSLDVLKSPEQHYIFAEKLRALRDVEILVLGSGNVVHNLRTISWNENEAPLEWASEYHNWIKTHLLNKDYSPLVSDFLKVKNGRLAVPTTEHYLPLIYCLGASSAEDNCELICEDIQNASISMLSFILS